MELIVCQFQLARHTQLEKHVKEVVPMEFVHSQVLILFKMLELAHYSQNAPVLIQIK